MRLHTFHLKARLAAASATAQLRRLLAVQTEGTVRQPLDLSELEDRILLSASPAAVMVDSAPAGESVEFATPLNSGGGTESLLESAASVTRLAESPQGEPDLQAAERAPELTATEVVFIDESAADFEQLVADLQSQRDAGRAVDIFVLDSQQDGVDQIAETLERYSDLDAVHIVSHGTDGAVKLGGTWLRIGSLDGYAGTIAGWGDAIGTDGDLLFYGCDLASNSRGEMLVESIAALTGADVAASTDDTGSSIRGGDWDLEYSAGSIETGVIFTDQLQAEWEGLLAVTPLTSTDEFRVNTTIGNVQETSNEDRGSTHAVAIAPNGEYVVVWSSNQITGSDGNGFGVLMQRFDATGNPISGELQVNQNTTFHQYHASVAVDDSGRGVVVWTDAENDADVQARLFHADGTFNGGEFLVNSTATSDQDNPSVAMDSSGNFVVVWEGSAPGDANGIHAQRFNAAGTKVGTEFTVNDTTTGTQSEPSVAMNSSGQFVVVWDDGGGVHARTYEADGTGGSGSQFNVDSTSSAGEADVGMDDTGRVVATWRQSVPLFGEGVYHRAFDFNGTPQMPAGVVNTQIIADQKNPSITIDATGNHIIAWSGNGLTDTDGVMFQKYDSSNMKIGGETAINQTLTGTQNQVSLAMLDTSNFVVVWSGEGPGDVSGVFARQYGTATANNNPTADAGGSYVINEGDGLNLVGTASSDPDGDALAFAWDLDNDGNYGEAGEPTTETPTVSWATLVSFGITDDPGSPFTIGLEVDDGNGNTNATTTTVTINNVNPTGNPDGGADFTTNEDMAFMTGSVLTNDTDPNSLDVLSVTSLDVTGTIGLVVNNNDGTFDYDPNGQFESLAQGQQTTDTFSYAVSDDDGGSSAATVTITIDGANDAPTDISLDNLSVSENAAGAVVGNLASTDIDTGDSHSYLVDDIRFEVVGSQLKLKAAASLDFETEQTVNVTVTSTDLQGSPVVKAFVLSVTDVNDIAPVIDPAQSFNIAEDVANSSVVGTVTATDSDTTGEPRQNWMIIGGDPAGVFSINSATGQITIADNSTLDFDTAPTSYALSVTVSDGTNTSDAEMLTINLTDVNDIAPVIDPAQSFNIAEDVANSSVVGTVTASDADTTGEPRQNWMITGGDPGGVFAINASTGQITIADNSTIDFETAPTSYTLSVTVSDGVNTSSIETVAITVLDQNDELPIVTPSQSFNVSESATNGTTLGTVTATDMDTGTTFSNWTITGGNTGGVFGINATTGTLSVVDRTNLDFETTPDYVLSVTVSDGVNTSTSQTISISVTNLNDNAPISNSDTYAVSQDTILNVASTSGVLANDTDADGTSLTALLVSGTANGSLTLQSDGSFTYTPDFEFYGVDSFSYQAFDGTFVSAARTVQLNVIWNVAPPPSAGSASSESSQGESVQEADSQTDTATSPAQDEESAVITAPAVGAPNFNSGITQTSTAAQSSDNSQDDSDQQLAQGPVGDTDDSPDFFTRGSGRMELQESAGNRSSSTSSEISSGISAEVEVSFQNSLRFAGEDLSYLVGTDFIQELEQVEKEFEFDGAVPEWAAGTAVATGASVSVGYIVWMLRGGYVLASVMSTLPVWQHIDPLPVLAALDATDDDDDESLQTMIDSASDKSDDLENPVSVESNFDNSREDVSV